MLQLVSFAPSSPSSTTSVYRRAGRRRAASALAYASGGLAFAAVAAILMLTVNDFELFPLRTITVLVAYSGPIVVMVAVVYGVRSSAAKRSLLAYAIMFGAIGILNAVTNGIGLSGAGSTIFLGVLYGGPSVVLLALFNRQFRSMAPVLMIIAAMAAVGAVLALVPLINDDVLRAVAGVGFSLGFGAWTVLVLVSAAGLFAVGWLGIKLARRLADAYRHKRLSEERLIVDSIWIFQSLIVSWPLQGLAFLAALPFLAYKLVSVAAAQAALQVLAPPASTEANGWTHEPAMLLLRVFARDTRSQHLLDDVASRWSYLGPIRLISAPDVARHSIDHNKLLLFLAGRLDELFLRNGDDLQKRLATLESGPDPDGRFRLEPFFCQGDIWKETVRHLIRATDITLMDLRGFNRTREGCIYEIEALLDLVPVRRLLLLVDGTTNTDDLSAVVSDKWSRLDAASPNLGPAAVQLAVLPVPDAYHDEELSDEVIAFADQAMAITAR